MWTISNDKSWQALQRFDWVRDMQGVPQSPIHHAEGDVAIHTQMVLKALEDLEEFQALDAQSQELLWASALLHDVEKRSTTSVSDDGSIVSPGHAKKGATTARSILYKEVITPFALRESVVGLVRHHGLPLWALEKPNPQKALLKASFEVNTAWVAMLAKADVLGRICKDQAELLYKIELFKEFCLENDCWGKAKVFPSPLGKFGYFRKEDQNADYLPFDDTKTEVVLLAGIAGSGKDRYLKKNYPQHQVVSLDDMRRAMGVVYGDKVGSGRVIQKAKELAKEYLRSQTPFVWNATNITLQMREQLIDLFATYQARAKIVYLEVPYQQLLQQNRNRDYAIPSDAIEYMIHKLEVPKDWEAHEVVWEV